MVCVDAAVQVNFCGISISCSGSGEKALAIYNVDQHPVTVSIKGIAIGLLAKMAFNCASTASFCKPIAEAIVLAAESLPYVSDACKIIGTENVITAAQAWGGLSKIFNF